MRPSAPTALVTGANRGIGLEVCRQLARQGMRVLLGARAQAKGGQAAAVLVGEGLQVRAVTLDVTSAASIATLRADIGSIDVLVNNAGVDYDTDQTALTADLTRVRRTFATNLFGAWATAQAFSPDMCRHGWGRIVNVSSIAGSLTEMGTEAPGYSASKAALNALSRTVAKAYGEQGIRTNTVSPAYVDTPIVREVLAQFEGSRGIAPEDLMAHFLKTFRPGINVGRPGRPEDVAAAVVFLASEAADYINGVNLRVDGGSVSTI